MVVSVTNLNVSYRNGGEPCTVLAIPEWSLEDGGQVVIRGPSGSGKSTLLNVIAGLLVPTGGTAEVCGQEITRMGEAARDRFRAGHIAYIFQTFNLLQGYSALENVLLGATFSSHKAGKSEAAALLEKVGLGHRGHHTPAEMSIGEQQRVAIARALVKKPGLILADEPTGSLDPRHAGEVVRLLRDASREHGCALIVVSHEAGVAAQFEKQIDFSTLNRALSGVTGGAA